MKLKIALIGAGTVGQGFPAILKEKEGLLKKNFSLEVEISALADLKYGEIKVSVKPEKISNSHPLAGINGATNALTFTTDYLQQVTISGPGAGKFETGYAVLNDLISIHKELMNKEI